MKKKILDILCCPVTNLKLSKVPRKKLANLNKAIQNKSIVSRDKTIISNPIQDALITEDDALLYPIEKGIPVLLENKSILLSQLN
jgi:uncharacterized protein YbaR (Trm112 family)|tara:strand:+ start:157 stop:411 length:255 start_codon:yes stop_codon:yes gene_type:complete